MIFNVYFNSNMWSCFCTKSMLKTFSLKSLKFTIIFCFHLQYYLKIPLVKILCQVGGGGSAPLHNSSRLHNFNVWDRLLYCCKWFNPLTSIRFHILDHSHTYHTYQIMQATKWWHEVVSWSFMKPEYHKAVILAKFDFLFTFTFSPCW